MSRRYELARSYADLSIGMLVKVECDCGRAHEGQLIKEWVTGEARVKEVLPVPPCTKGHRYGVRPYDVAAGVVFRILDGLELEARQREKADAR